MYASCRRAGTRPPRRGRLGLRVHREIASTARLMPLQLIIVPVLLASVRECPRSPASCAGILQFGNRSFAAAGGGLLLRWLFRDCRDWGDPTRTVCRDYLPVH